MGRRVTSMVTALGLLGSALIAVVLVPASPAAAACGDGALSNSAYGTFTGSNVNIRSGPSTTCLVVATGQAGETVRYDCWTEGTTVVRNGQSYATWSHVMDESIWTSGWVSDAYLSGGGAVYQCLANGYAGSTAKK
jgi:uncharacterized protein YraI